MKIRAFTCLAMLAAVPALAQEVALDLLPGHPIYHEQEQEAGVAMALSITPGEDRTRNLIALCEELQAAASLANDNGSGLRLETIFVVPYKDMAVEGHYLPGDGASGNDALVPGMAVARATLDDIVSRAGIPPRVLDATDVEQEISCALDEPLWFIAWYDVRQIGDEEPDAAIERAHRRFLAIHQSVVEHNATDRYLQEAQRATSGG